MCFCHFSSGKSTDRSKIIIRLISARSPAIENFRLSWIEAIDLIGVDCTNELSVERDNLESQLRAAEEERRREVEALRQNEIRRIGKEHNLTEVESQELEKLLEEMRPLGFTHSKQLSKYIVISSPMN